MRDIAFWASAPYILMLISGSLLWWLSSLRLRTATLGRLRALQAGRTFVFVLFLIGLFAAIGIMSFFASPLLWLISAVVLMAGVHRYRQAERKALLWALATAVQRGIPLEVAARAFSDERQGKIGIRAASLAEYLEAGLPISLALKRSGHSLPTAVFLAADLGQQTGTVGPALRQVVNQMDRLETTLQSAIEKFFYLGFLTIYALGILVFMMLKIVPVYVKIMEEFALELPAVTRAVIEFSDFFVEGWFVSVPLLLLVLLAFLAAVLHYVGYSPQNLPLISRLWLRSDSALIMRWLAVAARQQRPLAEFVRLLAGYFPRTSMQARLARAAKRIDRGTSWQDSLYRVGIIRRSDSRVFHAAERTGNLAWALDEMADSTLRRSAYRLRATLNVALPALLVIFGGVVLCFAVGMLLPLFKLIQYMA